MKHYSSIVWANWHCWQSRSLMYRLALGTAMRLSLQPTNILSLEWTNPSKLQSWHVLCIGQQYLLGNDTLWLLHDPLVAKASIRLPCRGASNRGVSRFFISSHGISVTSKFMLTRGQCWEYGHFRWAWAAAPLRIALPSLKLPLNLYFSRQSSSCGSAYPGGIIAFDLLSTIFDMQYMLLSCKPLPPPFIPKTLSSILF